MARERSNDDWLHDLRAGDATAIADLTQRLRGGLGRALASRRQVDDSDLEDFAQDAVLRVLDRLDRYQGASRFTTWAHAVAVNHALTELRRRRWQDVSLTAATAEGTDFEPADDDAGPSHVAEHSELLQVLRNALDTALTEKQRTAMTLLLEELPYPAVAERMGIKLNALYKLAHDARSKLRDALQSAGFDDDEVRARLAAASK
ncbi:MAG: sigma-70 family RNA polymerase sigma factor [bacterium]|nr:sigma-70 family RNA polymerase sigma factor [bacterium]